jgi:nucleotide-binding universal stress UspA family protein
MSNASDPARVDRKVEIILHPTDFSPASDLALAHALRLAITNKADLRIFHVADDASEDTWEKFPSVRRILSKWGMIDKDSDRSAVTALGIQIEKVLIRGTSVANAIEAYCTLNDVGMIVLSTEGRDGISAWIKPSLSERIANKVAPMMIPVLFVPANCKGCVSLESGEVSMEQVLIPVDHEPSSVDALESGLRALNAYGSATSQLTLLHVGTASKFPDVSIPEETWEIERVVSEGNPAAEILAVAEKRHANLIIMVTAGTNGWLDAIRGSTTDQVLREAKCPVLAMPYFS